MICREVYRFHLIAKTPLHFGGSETGRILLREDDQQQISPFLSGNSIGGVLRNWLKNEGRTILASLNLTIEDLMGGEVEIKSENKIFQMSHLRIDDGQLNLPVSDRKRNELPNKRGTAINASTGTAQEHALYTYEYLPQGTECWFEISCDIDGAGTEKLNSNALKKIMRHWATAIEQGIVRFGGKKSYSYGFCTVGSVSWLRYAFHSAQKIDQYLFDRTPSFAKMLEWEVKDSPIQVNTIQMQGSFPYGVYTGDFNLMGQSAQTLSSKSSQYVIPASSIKGVLRHEVRKLILKMLNEKLEEKEQKESLVQKAEQLVNRLFGGTDHAGLITVYDLHISGQEVQVNRTAKEIAKQTDSKESPTVPKYIKIDRITGGAVSGQLKTQHEVQGDGIIKLEVRPSSHQKEFDLDCIWFPLVYVLRRIGSGRLPVGGRTSIGLGIFHATENLNVILSNHEQKHITVYEHEQMDEEVKQWLRHSYNLFKRWCHDGDKLA